jgi:hypothetical protein
MKKLSKKKKIKKQLMFLKKHLDKWTEIDLLVNEVYVDYIDHYENELKKLTKEK